MHSPTERSPQIVAADGHADLVKSGTGMGEKMGVILDLEGQKAPQICSFMWEDNFLVMSHSKAHLEQMLKDLNQEAEGLDLETKPASLWWTSTSDTETGRCGIQFEEFFFDSL